MAEDCAPFDVEVTTHDMGEAAISRSNTADEYYGMRVLISPISSVIGVIGMTGDADVFAVNLVE